MDTATTKQFRAAVWTVVGHKVAENARHYTDSAGHGRHRGPGRHVAIEMAQVTEEDVKNIEFILWCQGVTAKTRWQGYGRRGFVRGTCVIGD